jgi:hypothetical protein
MKIHAPRPPLSGLLFFGCMKKIVKWSVSVQDFVTYKSSYHNILIEISGLRCERHAPGGSFPVGRGNVVRWNGLSSEGSESVSVLAAFDEAP